MTGPISGNEAAQNQSLQSSRRSASDHAWLAAFGQKHGAGAGSVTDRSGRTVSLIHAPQHWAPAIADTNTSRVIFDGILHNSDELRALFPGRLTAQSSAADIVALAYQQWGANSLLRFKGIFALIVWDSARSRLLCTRDPVGLHPLFYATADRTLLLSPSIETLLAHPGVSGDLNRPALVDHLSRRWLSNEDTYFTEVRRVLPCHVLEFDGEDRRIYRYWDPAPTGGSGDWIPDGEAEERFDASLTQAVARCVAIAPSAINLSGGIDSSSVAMMAADVCQRLGRDKPLALSLVMPGPHVDEADTQRAIAAALDLPHVQVALGDAVGRDGAFVGALEMSRTMAAPLSTLLRLPLFQMALEASRRGRGVILTGDGGDEWVAVNPHFAADLLRAGNLLGVYRLWRTLMRSYSSPIEIPLRGMYWRWGARPLLREIGLAAHLPALVRRFASSSFDRARRKRVPRPPLWIAADPALRAQIGRREAEAWDRVLAYSDTRSYSLRFSRSMLELPQKIMFHEETFAVGRRSRVRVTPPFWDSDLIELLMRIRPQARMRDGYTKSLLRASLLPRFPALGFDRRLKSYTGNVLLSAITEGAQAARRSMGRISALSELEVVDGDAVERFLDRALASNDHQSWLRVWDILSLEGWVRERLSRGVTRDRH